MGLLDSLKQKLSGLLGGSQPGEQNLAQKCLDLINDPNHGGLQGVVKTYQEKGLGGVVGSWVGTGQNQSITPVQVTAGVGRDRVNEIAVAQGTSHESIAQQLSHLLPGLIDKLTPQGQI